MDYASALAWLYRRQTLGVKLELDNMRALLSRLGEPQKGLRVLHVTGTTGKGSTSLFLADALRAAGHRAGLYQSPHLVSFRERILVDGEPISEADVAAGIARLRPHVEALDAQRVGPTYFECATALAYDHFRRAGIDLAVLEVGLGGRLDATNTCEPVVSVITNVGLDHTQVLGTSVQAIAREKGGILRANVPAVTGARREALDVLVKEATRVGAPLRVVRAPDADATGLDGNRFHFTYDGEKREFSTTALGEHQVANASVALSALDSIRESVPVPYEAARQGLQGTVTPCRLEIVRREPTQILDGAHNAEAMDALGRFLGDHFPDQPIAACVGILRDKPAQRMLRLLADRTTRLVLTQAPNQRALRAAELAQMLPSDAPPCTAHDNIEDALRDLYAGNEPVTVVTGSMYLAGEARARLLRLPRDPDVQMLRWQ